MTICFVGVFGNGVAPLAIYAAHAGHTVFGHDDVLNHQIKDLLISQKITILPEKILTKKCDLIVYSSAIDTQTHELISQAKERKIPCIRRGEFLQKITENKKLIAIIGSHGKTSVCASIAEIILKNNIKADYILGAFFKNDKFLPSKFSETSEFVVAEVDESDRTIDCFSPYHTVALNFDDDHAENYNGLDGLKNSFEQIFDRTKHSIFMPKCSQVLNELANKSSGKVKNYTICDEKPFYEHNIDIAKFVSNDIFREEPNTNIEFVGAKFRNETIGSLEDVVFLQDYAHHPTELESLLQFLRKKFQDHTLHIIFQPHRFSRVAKYSEGFAKVLQKFDQITLLPIYSAFEKTIENASSEDIFEKIDNLSKILLKNDLSYDTFRAICNSLYEHTRSKKKKSVMIFVAAGSLTKISQLLVNEEKIHNLELELCEKNIKNVTNFPLAGATTLKIGGTARLLIEPNNIYELKTAISLCKKYEIKPIIIGRGSNLLIRDGKIEQVFIKLSGTYFTGIKPESENMLICGAGAKLQAACMAAAKENFANLEHLAGIPGTIGGAIMMNAGAHGHSISEFVKSIDVMDENGDISTICKEQIEFQYRETTGLENKIILSVTLEFKEQKSKADIMHKIEELRNWRLEKQPQQPSAGSVFKNPANFAAGYLIEQVGLKGFRIGDVGFSEKHANFIVNYGNGKSYDVEKLIDIARFKVREKFDIFLENEIKIIGSSQ